MASSRVLTLLLSLTAVVAAPLGSSRKEAAGAGKESSSAPSPISAAAVYEGGEWQVVSVSASSAWPEGALAYGSYDEARLSSHGWAVLDVAAAEVGAPEEHAHSMFGLGLLEGYFTCARIEEFNHNYATEMFSKNPPSPQLIAEVEGMLSWVRAQAAASVASDSDYFYWTAVQGVLAQFDGLLAGYQRYCPEATPMKMTDLLLLNLNGDLFDLLPACQTCTKGKNSAIREVSVRTGVPLPDTLRDIDRPAHCSAAIKLVPGAKRGHFTDLLIAHATWDTYTNMYPRIYKHVSVPVWRATDEVKMSTVSFSSSPGFISSIDDFYSLSGSTELYVMETSLNVLDESTYSALTTQSVPYWIRSVVANRLAESAQDWTEIYSIHHSGTYNDMWMVVDRSRFVPDQPLSEQPVRGLLWVLEEGPGLIIARDMTEKLISDGHWASFNIPQFEEMRDWLGYTAATEKYGAEYSYSMAPRARLFKELLPKVNSIEDMQWLIRWNDYQHDAFCNGDPVKAIAARGDLLRHNKNSKPKAYGAIDSKVSAWSMTVNNGPAALATAGPTRMKQPMFCWTAEFSESHKGHPKCFDHDSMEMAPSTWLHRRVENPPVRQAGPEQQSVVDVSARSVSYA